jgi:ketosteroid isomerase-like protein
MTVLDELNRDIWQPFRRTYGARDLTGYLDLYDRDLIRAGGPAKEVHGFDRLAADMTGWFAEIATRGDHLDIDFRFTERIAAAGLASERGYYQITATLADATTRVRYGRFHTFARQRGGRWRLVVDYDTDDPPVTAETFAAAAGIEEASSDDD